MIRFMIDTDDLHSLTGHAELLATYADLVTDVRQLEREFPHSQIILIHRGLGDPTGEASVFDIEPGALTPEQAVALYDDAVKREIRFLTAYHDRQDAQAVADAFGKRPHYNWDATLDGTAHIKGYDPLHSPAVIQCLSAHMLDAHVDGSLVFEDNWHPRPASLPVGNARAHAIDALTHANALTIDLRETVALLGG